MLIRERQEQLERETLGAFSALSENSRGRARPERECDIRTAFCRDRDRIIHSKAFRRLKQKTQVFLSPEGDHFRTRLTHTLEVSQIARTLARAMRFNEDLTEAISMGHDLGHTPFGHAGERALDKLSSLGFRHYEQSVRVVERIEKDHLGLNLTYETIDGILNHTTGSMPGSMEGQIVRLSDRIAYINHDIEDAISAKVLSESMLPADVVGVLGTGKSKRITTLINSLVQNSSGDSLSYADDVKEAFASLHEFMFEHIYLNTECDVKSEEIKVYDLIGMLFESYTGDPGLMPEFYRVTALQESPERAAMDYISGMSDAYAVHSFKSLFIPKSWAFQ
ncbi:MAG: deoxyguanosinetriphosphate triphosphohydrolase [Oscillospiraceae bacterium]|nr:deoxyguanosinetriphosphate triphosphohydrolase [Oscillospiraceae bacterium]